jgi:hypothetical protein
MYEGKQTFNMNVPLSFEMTFSSEGSTKYLMR